MKRRSYISRKLRDRRAGKSPYARYNKSPYKYSFKKAKKPTEEQQEQAQTEQELA